MNGQPSRNDESYGFGINYPHPDKDTPAKAVGNDHVTCAYGSMDPEGTSPIEFFFAQVSQSSTPPAPPPADPTQPGGAPGFTWYEVQNTNDFSFDAVRGVDCGAPTLNHPNWLFVFGSRNDGVIIPTNGYPNNQPYQVRFYGQCTQWTHCEAEDMNGLCR